MSLPAPSPASDSSLSPFRLLLGGPAQRGWIALGLALGIGAAALGAVEPLFYRFLMDLLVKAASLPAAARRYWHPGWLALAGLAAVLLLQRCFQTGQTLAVNRVRFDSSFQLSAQVLRHLYAQPLGFHQQSGAGYVLTRVDRGIAALGQLISDVLLSLAPNSANLVIMTVFLFRLSPRLAWIGIAPMPLFLWATMRGAGELVRHEEVVQEGWGQLYSRVTEVLAGIKTVKSLACEEAEVHGYRRRAAEIFERLWRLVWVDEGYGQLKSALGLSGRIAVAGYGFALVLRGQLTPGTWIAATSYASLLYGPLAGLAGTYSSIARGLVSTRVVFDFLRQAPEAHALPEAQTIQIGFPSALPRLRGDVVFEQVSYAYAPAFAVTDGAPTPFPPEAPRWAIDGMSFRIAAGETVAVIGPSGGGKTTLMDLLLRFHDPAEGRILFDGRDLRSVPPPALRRQVAVVLQDPVLLSGTIGENIAYGSPDATPGAIRAAARAAQAEEFIERLPGGFEARLGERGARLSGGEKQRLAIARALLRDPRILILDEATAHLDAGSEAALNLALRTLLRGRTAFLISHRLASLPAPNRILVIDGGRLVENGTPEQLLAGTGFYARWRNAQPTVWAPGQLVAARAR